MAGERDEHAGNIKAGLILIFKFCGETTLVRKGWGNGGKRDREDDEDGTKREQDKEKGETEKEIVAHNRFSNS